MSFPLPSKLKVLQPLWHALSPLRRRQLLGLQLLSLLAAAGEVANLGLLMPFLKLLANPQRGLNALGPLAGPLRSLPDQHLLLVLGLGFMSVVIASTLLRVWTIHLQMEISSFIATDLGDQVFANVIKKPFIWHLNSNSSTVLGYLTNDTGQAFLIIQSLLALVVNLTIVMFLGGALIALAPQQMLLTIIFLGSFYIVVFQYTRSQLRADGQRVNTNYRASLRLIQESLGGIRDLLLDQTQSFFLGTYHNYNLKYRIAQADISKKVSIPRYLIEGFTILLIMGMSLQLAMAGQGIEQQLPLLGSLALGAYRLLQPLQQCFNSLSTIQSSQDSLANLAPLLIGFDKAQAHSSPVPSTVAMALPMLASEHSALVELKNVSFRYSGDGPWVLRDLSLAIAPGERLAFVGSTGSGKSTTSDLILGLLKPTEGQIVTDGHELHDHAIILKSWQKKVAHVPQQIYLSDSSFAANIAFGVPDDLIDHERVRHAARQARIAELIESNPEGYAAVVGERGVRLSGGQRQRIGIARALYKQAKLLVLDEATSALDNRTEAEVMAAIEALDRQITVILIAHRLSTVERCDRIVLLEQGRISAIGSYPDLIRSHSGFQALAQPTKKLPV